MLQRENIRAACICFKSAGFRPEWRSACSFAIRHDLRIRVGSRRSMAPVLLQGTTSNRRIIFQEPLRGSNAHVPLGMLYLLSSVFFQYTALETRKQQRPSVRFARVSWLWIR